MKEIILSLLLLGFAIQSFSQGEVTSPADEIAIHDVEILLPEVEIMSVNYRYLNSVGTSEVAIPVKILEKTVANYDILTSEFYIADEPFHHVLFKIPEGKILAVYNNKSEIIRTSEKFRDIPLALCISNAVVDKYPGWRITGDIYMVKYKRKNNKFSKTYTLFIEKNGKKKRLKTDEKGNFL